MSIDPAKVAKLAGEVNELEEALAAARARLMDAVAGAASGSAPVPQVPISGSRGNSANWGTVTDAILGYAMERGSFEIPELTAHMMARGYKGKASSLKARVYQLLAEKKLKREDRGVFKKA